MNEMNCIAVPEAMKGNLEPEGILEMSYKLVDKDGTQYIQVTDVEGNPVESSPETPLDKMANKMGVTKKFGAPKEASYEEGL